MKIEDVIANVRHWHPNPEAGSGSPAAHYRFLADEVDRLRADLARVAAIVFEPVTFGDGCAPLVDRIVGAIEQLYRERTEARSEAHELATDLALASERARREQAELDLANHDSALGAVVIDMMRRTSGNVTLMNAAIWSAFVAEMRRVLAALYWTESFVDFRKSAQGALDRAVNGAGAYTNEIRAALGATGEESCLDAAKRVVAECDSSFDRGRRVGREDVGKYANAIGRIESAIGRVGIRPLDETVRLVEETIGHWRTQAAQMERERDSAQAAELRQLKVNERLVAELQEARAVRVPEDVRRTIEIMCRAEHDAGVAAMVEHVVRWLDALPREEGAK